MLFENILYQNSKLLLSSQLKKSMRQY